jgi:hypothetical protein
MRFDADRDGKLTREEVDDPRLQALFDRADANKDGSVGDEELRALYAREGATLGPGGGGPGGRGGPGGGPGGPGGGPGRFGGPPQPGRVLPAFVQEMLGLSETQKAELDELQKHVDARLDKILTDGQKAQLREMASRGPGGFGPPGGGPGGFGPPGGGRPGGGPRGGGPGGGRPPGDGGPRQP